MAVPIQRPDASITHQTEGRVRVRIPSMKGDDGYFGELRKVLQGVAEVDDVQANSATGGVLILHHGRVDPILRHAERIGFFRLNHGFQLQDDSSGVSLASRLSIEFQRMEQDLQTASKGKLDMATVTLGGLLGIGAYQIWQGKVLPPAWAFLWAAYSLVAWPKVKVETPTGENVSAEASVAA